MAPQNNYLSYYMQVGLLFTVSTFATVSHVPVYLQVMYVPTWAKGFKHNQNDKDNDKENKVSII